MSTLKRRHAELGCDNQAQDGHDDGVVGAYLVLQPSEQLLRRLTHGEVEDDGMSTPRVAMSAKIR
jgi:hypothetical protein